MAWVLFRIDAKRPDYGGKENMLKLIRQCVFSNFDAYASRFFNSFVKPRFINFITTYKCNSGCLTCGIWSRYRQEGNEESKQELTLPEIRGFFLNNKKYFSRLISIGLTGGEFTLRNDAVDIVRFFHDHFPRVILGFQTNGLDPDRVRSLVSDILKFDPDFNIAVSIDGPREIHDKVRGINGAFDKALLTVKYARELGLKRITSGMTINPINFSYISDVYKICQDIGTEFSCFLMETSSYFNNDGTSYQLNDEQKKAIIDSLRQFPNDYYMDNLRLYLEHKRNIALPCYSGYTSLVIDPYGNIKPCILKDVAFGNIKRDNDFKAIMSRIETRKVRKNLKSCHCWSQCEVSSSAFVGPLDIAWWFVFYCQDKKGFLRKILRRWG
jgi:MoaA/NifB/PqqE/SkfB family radical SAM enzyme